MRRKVLFRIDEKCTEEVCGRLVRMNCIEGMDGQFKFGRNGEVQARMVSVKAY